jgi:hypothetical protein
MVFFGKYGGISRYEAIGNDNMTPEKDINLRPGRHPGHRLGLEL